MNLYWIALSAPLTQSIPRKPLYLSAYSYSRGAQVLYYGGWCTATCRSKGKATLRLIPPLLKFMFQKGPETAHVCIQPLAGLLLRGMVSSISVTIVTYGKTLDIRALLFVPVQPQSEHLLLLGYTSKVWLVRLLLGLGTISSPELMGLDTQQEHAKGGSVRARL